MKLSGILALCHCCIHSLNFCCSLTKMMKLKTIFMAHNFVYQWDQFAQLGELPSLKDLVFLGNPLEEELSEVSIKTELLILADAASLG